MSKDRNPDLPPPKPNLSPEAAQLWLLDELYNTEYSNVALLPVLLKYLNDHQDADGDSEGYYPNDEMTLLGDFEQRFGRIEA